MRDLLQLSSILCVTVSAQVTTGSSAKTADAIKQEKVSKDNDLVFVAGATGRVGSRTVRLHLYSYCFSHLVSNTSNSLICINT